MGRFTHALRATITCAASVLRTSLLKSVNVVSIASPPSPTPTSGRSLGLERRGATGDHSRQLQARSPTRTSSQAPNESTLVFHSHRANAVSTTRTNAAAASTAAYAPLCPHLLWDALAARRSGASCAASRARTRRQRSSFFARVRRRACRSSRSFSLSLSAVVVGAAAGVVVAELWFPWLLRFVVESLALSPDCTLKPECRWCSVGLCLSPPLEAPPLSRRACPRPRSPTPLVLLLRNADPGASPTPSVGASRLADSRGLGLSPLALAAVRALGAGLPPMLPLARRRR